MNRVTPGGLFVLTYLAPSGRAGWRLRVPNGVTAEGVNHLADAAFRAVGRFTTWYAGLIDDAGFSAVAAADTHAAHPGWSEFTSVFGSVRAAWTPNPAVGGALASGAATVLQVTAAGTVRGAFLASRAAVGTGTGAVIYCTAAAAAGRAVAAGGTLSLTYQLRLSPR